MSEEKNEAPGAVDVPAGHGITDGADIDFKWGVKIPLRDGVYLNATLYMPIDSGNDPVPLIFTLTPYVSDTYHERGIYFAHNGYAFALVDVRGRGNSEGEFEPVVNEARDGHDVVEWFAKQPWCDGQVTMWGGSYAGFDQWATLKEFPAGLATIVPVASGYPSLDFPFPGNIFANYFIQWMTYTSGVTPNANLFGEFPFWTEKFSQLYFNHRPTRDLDKIVGNHSTHFQTWLDHAKQGPYWDSSLPTEEDYSRIDVPILTITGHYDGDQNGAMGFYNRHMQYGTPEAKEKHYLVIGPWDHAGTRTPRKSFGGLTFGDASLVDMNKLHKDWYDWTMKDGEKPEFLEKRVAIYVMDADEWQFFDSLEDIPAEKKKFYLDSKGGAGDVFNSGTMSEDLPTLSETDSYVYDPLDTRPGELERKPNPNYITDQTNYLNLFKNGLIYHSKPFAEDVELTGWIKLFAWISMDVKDTDFHLQVSEILPDGTAISLSDSLLRARYRESLREEKLIIPGEVNCFEFDNFAFTSRRLRKGSRLRLLIHCPNSLNLQKNYNSGGDVSRESGADAHTAHITLHHSEAYPSFLEVPIIKQ
ncbi:MAG: CocE/NonD family hydrolase [Anaerolineaceae bacterium]|nr:CocE/NonD family hydrolase [Anaerolineaceae bacterium]